MLDKQKKLPDFIIGGGMKCGTTSLHYLLNKHPQIFIPNNEPHFFTLDDIEQNPEFFIKTKQGWNCWDFDKNLPDYLRWYYSFFHEAKENQVIGEDCVSYLYSSQAPARIAKIIPNVKLIFILRDPVARTYSQYWHWVKTNRAIYSFEDMIQFSSGHLLQRGFYRQHLARYFQYFEREQIKVILFEDFIKNVQEKIDEVCEFLQLNQSVNVSNLEAHQNSALVPRNLRLHLLFNNLFKTRICGRKYQISHLPNANISNQNIILDWLTNSFNQLNLTSNKPYPQMHPDTRQFLEQLFAKENSGLSQLIDFPVEQFWSYV
ncbi:sulfotransferase [Anabaena cylindrica FACHB-243]|uniref:Sulfotransferase n=1 Tax=Anabaena cylindrica (strain ATCC 27899 / PCC 7122) TaxID=272123 RepID=K9ZRJ2_ANACC|nr:MULTISPECIES: sulfotransferase [Anabaena]AFZ61384.1 sulfotransferase [Anabaena cylindrica PCC 7122]MBD2420380.1 sulfotransferase [Anabaena cylindrica FACHB-243]MBY5281872.1 sulfotransferase [Anabaena sp. CCAP 1446/1C]MBY5306979.1 sulfotransferase [Anabaena sp. CCAP 1446/1C]MCM2405997.1 sulfotransferase [Anabaena sp. CCAP 1446/1C]